MANIDYTNQTLDNKYLIVRQLGVGGMGAVYLGQHIIIGRHVAVKFLHAEYTSNEEIVKRFYREAQAAATIRHGNIIDVFDVGVSSEGEPYLVMEYLEGESLASMLERMDPIDLPAACGIMEPALLAISAAHEKGVIHRDLKPENIFLATREDGTASVKLIDFGISKFTSIAGQTKLTTTGSLLGTPMYMSPEQARGGAGLDHRTDVYSMGVILYEMLTGELPFKGDNYNELLINILTSAPIPPGEAYPDFPAEAEPIITKALQREPDNRYQTAAEMLEALQKLSEFSQRQNGFTVLASAISVKSFAAGDLGKEIALGDQTSVASQVLSQFAKNETPDAWSRTASGRSKLGIGLFMATSVVLIFGAVILAFFLKDKLLGTETPVPSTVPLMQEHSASGQPLKPKQAEAESVTIKIVDAPEGSKIYFRNSLVMENPFRVSRGDTLVPIRIEAEGFDPFSVSIEPSMDRTIKASLVPVIKAEAETGKKKSGSSKSSSSRRSKRRKKSKSEEPEERASSIKKGSRGTQIASDFE